jgi:hypothetical protein
MTESTEPAERWLPAVSWRKGVFYDYTGLYEVSSLGRVQSLNHLTGGPHGPMSRVFPGKMLDPYIRPDGYPEVSLSKNGRTQKHLVHHIVLCTFVRAPEPGEECRHGPGGKLDASISNVCWGTREENIADRLRDEQDNRGERHGNAKLTDGQVREIRERVAAGELQRLIAADYGVNISIISLIARGEAWGHVDGQRTMARTSRAALTADDVREIRRQAALGASNLALATRFEVKPACISKVVTRRSWAHVE